MNPIQPVSQAQQVPSPFQPQPVPFAPVQMGLSAENKLALLEYWNTLKRRKGPILALGAVTAIVAGAVAFAMTPVYKSTATVLVEQSKNKVLAIDEMFGGAMQSKEHYQTQVEILKSREVALKTTETLKLWKQPEFDPRQTGGLKGIFGSAPVTKWTDETLANAAVEGVMKAVAVEPVRLSQLVKVSFESPDQALAAKVANQVAASYIELDREQRIAQARSLNGWLEERASDLRSKVTAAETALQAYREKEGLINLQGSAQALASKQIDSAAQRLADARARRMFLESAYQGINGSVGGDYSNVPAVVNSSGVQAAIAREAEAARQVATLSQSLGPNHPSVEAAQGALAEARASKRAQTQAVVKSVREDYTNARRAEASVEAELASASGGVQNVNRKEFQLAVLQRELDSNKQLYDMFMLRAKELSSGADLQAAVARVVDPAVVSETPVRPRKGQIVIVAFMLGSLLGALIALLQERLDNTIKGADTTEAKLHTPVLTVLPLLGEDEGIKAHAMFLQAPSSLMAEAIRTARTGVLLSNIDTPHRVLMVTSSLPSEGKSTTAINLAFALAQTKRTLLIDTDMRKPTLASRLGLPGGSKGLSNLVTGTATLKECVHPVEGSPLMVIPAGDMPPNPLELLQSQRFADVLEHLKPQLDFIILDTPPVELVSDSLTLASMATDVVFVVRSASSTLPVARKSIERLKRAGGRLQGIVVNGLDLDKAQSYYGETSFGAYSGYKTYGTYGAYGTTYGSKKPGDAPETIQAS